MEEKEEGEISLEDVSSSEEGQSSYNVPWVHGSRMSSTMRNHRMREVDINPQDAGHGKENRRYSREILASRYTLTLHEKNEDLLPISSDEEIETVGIPGTSHQLHIHLGKKKRKKKKRKKTGGILLVDDFVSSIEPDPLILNVPKLHFAEPTEVNVHRRRRSPSPVVPRRRSPLFASSRVRSPPRSPPRMPPRLYRPTFRGRSPSPRGRYSRSPSPRRRSPRRFRSPRMSPVLSREKSPRRSCHHSPERYADRSSTLLKKVRHLETVGTASPTYRKYKEHGSSLKEKLSNMLRVSVDTNEPLIKREEVQSGNESSKSEEEEEDLARLRRLALETKHQRSERTAEDLKMSVEPEHLSDNDPEDLELRMIALKSAVMKKHQNRVKKGTKKKTKHSLRDMSPFEDSLLKELGTEEQNSTITPPNQQVEDMDLDTDVEREKENYSEPYSPTDEVMRNLADEGNDEHAPEPNKVNGFADGDPENDVSSEAPYSPSDPTKTPWVDRFEKAQRISSSKDVKINTQINSIKSESNEEVPYSPSDTPVYDPELPDCPPELLDATNDNNLTSNCVALELPTKEVTTTASSDSKVNLPFSDGETAKVQLKEPSASPNDSPVIVDNVREPQEQNMNEEMKQQQTKEMQENEVVSRTEVSEPLYLQGVPDVTKEPNKIPTLVNRTLVPVSILKTNKNLQQPLPPKKIEAPTEPVFKSAEMQPVESEPAKTSASFKPIKLQTATKKPAVIMPAPVFNSSVDEANAESSGEESETSRVSEISEMSEVQNQLADGLKDMKTIVGKKKNKRGRKKNRKNWHRGGKNRAEQRLRMMWEEKRKVEAEVESEVNSTLEDSHPKEAVPNNVESSTAMEVDPNKGLDSNEDRSSSGSPNDTEDSNKSEQKKDDSKIDDQTEEVASQSTDKKRRNSIEEDEEALRALLLASLAKRPKTTDFAVKISEVPKTPEVTKVSQPNVESNDNTKGPEVAMKPQLKPTTEVPLNIQQSESAQPSSVVEKPPISVCAPSQVTQPLNSVVESRKRPNLSVIRGPPKKIIKKVPVLVSTKVVNNAKKFQNTLIQKKLSLQNQVKQMNIAGTSRNLVFNNVRTCDSPAPMSPKIAATKVQRLVINLGEDSDSESEEHDEAVMTNGMVSESRAVLSIPTTDFEKSVDQFLKDQRKKLESMAPASVPGTSTPTPVTKGAPVGLQKSNGLGVTPLAVRHLPPSQQEEYKRLKQQILERERQKANRQKTNNTPPGPLSPGSPATKPTKVVATKPSLTAVKLVNSAAAESKIIASSVQINAKVTVKVVENNLAAKASTLPKSIPAAITTPSKSVTASNFSAAITTLSKSIAGSNLSVAITTPSNSIAASNLSKTFPVSSISSTMTSTPVKSMTNLRIQIPNDNLASNERIVSSKPENSEQSAAKAPPVLKILTKDQLNMKIVQVQLKQAEQSRTAIVNEAADKAIEPRSSEAVTSSDTLNNTITLEANTSELSFNETDKTSVSNQTNQTVASVDSEASTVILPPPNEATEAANWLNNESGNTTIVLNDTAEYSATPLKTTPSKLRRNKSPVKELSERIKSDVRMELEHFVLLTERQQQDRLKEMEQKLVTKRYAVLDDLTEMSGTLRQWDMERELQTNLIAEVRRLRAQLAIAEERLLDQRTKIKNMAPRVTKAHGTISQGRAECLKFTKLCQGIGSKVVGQQYKVPSTGAQLMMERLKEVAFHTRQLSKKKVPYLNNEVGPVASTSDGQPDVVGRAPSADCDGSSGEQSDGNIDGVNSGAGQADNATGVVISRSTRGQSIDPLPKHTLSGSSSTPCALTESGTQLRVVETSPNESVEKQEKSSQLATRYESVLSNVRTPRHIDLNRELCPYELTGVCKDEGCLYNHLDPKRRQ